MFFPFFSEKLCYLCLFTYVATFVSLQSQFPFPRNAVARFVQNVDALSQVFCCLKIYKK